MNRVVIALGSNITPEKHIRRAKKRIDRQFGIIKTSEFVWTQPIGNTDQPDFLNGVVLIETEMEISELKSWLHVQEDAMGRVRREDRFGPRSIDMDIIIWNEDILDKDVFERNYLACSVKEILPGIFF